MHIREIRKAKGMTMKQLGEIVGVTESAIGQYENGKRKPDYEMLLKISEALDSTVDELLNGNKIPATANSDRQLGDLELAASKADERTRVLIQRLLNLPPDQISAFLAITQSSQDDQ